MRGDELRDRRRFAFDCVRRRSCRARRNRRGADRRRGGPQPERPDAGHAARRRSRCCPRTTSCSAGRAASRYLGCRFPADPAYAAAITREAVKVGERLAEEGVIGRFAVDFVVVRSGGGWDPVRDRAQPAQGRYDASVPHAPVPDRRRLRPGDGRVQRRRAAARSTSSRPTTSRAARYRSLTPDDLFDIVVRRGLHFDQSRQTGVVFHMMSALGEHGRTGLTAVADDPAGRRRSCTTGSCRCWTRRRAPSSVIDRPAWPCPRDSPWNAVRDGSSRKCDVD